MRNTSKSQEEPTLSNFQLSSPAWSHRSVPQVSTYFTAATRLTVLRTCLRARTSTLFQHGSESFTTTKQYDFKMEKTMNRPAYRFLVFLSPVLHRNVKQKKQ